MHLLYFMVKYNDHCENPSVQCLAKQKVFQTFWVSIIPVLVIQVRHGTWNIYPVIRKTIYFDSWHSYQPQILNVWSIYLQNWVVFWDMIKVNTPARPIEHLGTIVMMIPYYCWWKKSCTTWNAKKNCKYWDKLPTNWLARFLNHQQYWDVHGIQ